MNVLKTSTAILLIAALSAPHAYADKRQKMQRVKGGATFVGATVAGAVVGGPIGAIIGALSGALLGEQGQKKLEQQRELEASAMKNQHLEEAITTQNLEIAQLEAMIAEKMQFQMFFKTGEAELNEADKTQVYALADFLNDSDYMHVTIDGHADPRGDDAFNQVLSESRAQSVASILEENGIASYRMEVKGHGSSFSDLSISSLDEYAQQRRVNIQVFPSQDSTKLARAK